MLCIRVWCIHVCTCVWGSHIPLCSHVYDRNGYHMSSNRLLSTLVSGTGSVSKPGTHYYSARPTDEDQALEIHLFLPLHTKTINVHCCTPHFVWVLGTQTHILRLYPLNRLPIPYIRFLKEQYKNVIAPISTTADL